MGRPIRHRQKWRIRWLDEHGARQSEVHDDYKAAASALRQHEVLVDEIRRGVRPGPPVEKTFDQLADYWIENRASQKRSGKDDESIIRRHLRPSFGPLKLRELNVAHADRFVTDRSHLDKKTVSNLLTLLLAMLNCALDLEWLEKVPRIKKPRVRIFERDFCYLRTDSEIRRFLAAAEEEGQMVHALYATAMLTGAREGELAALTWGDVDFERRLITIQRSFEGPTKANDVRYVPVLDELLPILRAWRLRNPNTRTERLSCASTISSVASSGLASALRCGAPITVRSSSSQASCDKSGPRSGAGAPIKMMGLGVRRSATHVPA